MRNSWIIRILILMYFMLCRSAIANELFRYNYVKAVYGKATYDMQGSSQKADGSLYGVIGSYAIHELVAIGVQYEKTKKALMEASPGRLFRSLVLGIHWLWV